MNVCTIIAKNYVAHARVLARSLREHDPPSRLWTLIIDDFSGYIDPEGEPFAILTPDQIGCEPFIPMALRYSVLSLSTATKPWLLRHLMSETGEPVTYLDPDIKIYGSLRRLEELAAHHDAVLIPNNTKPVPPPEGFNSWAERMMYGVYNLGYVSLAPGSEVDQMLDWLVDRLRRDCRVDPTRGYFVDQRWFDLVPSFLPDVAIMRDPEYNVAWWNLHERRLDYRDGRYLVDGRPLAFFHFSHFDADNPLALTTYDDPVDLTGDPPLEQIAAEYATDVTSEGHRTSRRWPYSYAALGDGTPLEDMVRDLYGDLYDEFLETHDESVPSPFTLEGARAFEDWLRQQAAGAPADVNRLLASMYEVREDLRTAFPDVGGEDRVRLLDWANRSGRQEVPLLARVIDGQRGSDGVSSSETSADRDAVRTALEPVADQLEPCVDHESELREQLTRSRVVEAQLREQIEQARLAVAERDASLDAIRSTRAWRAVTRWWSFKRHLTARW